jgi:large subunit ribosomal protein L29
MKSSDIRNLSMDELQAKDKELTQELFNLSFQLQTGRLEKSSQIQSVRKDIARVKTILREKRG